MVLYNISAVFTWLRSYVRTIPIHNKLFELEPIVHYTIYTKVRSLIIDMFEANEGLTEGFRFESMFHITGLVGRSSYRRSGRNILCVLLHVRKAMETFKIRVGFH